jgi:hypothetical protein
MSALKQRARIARVRAIQHRIATGKSLQAQQNVRTMEENATQLERIRQGLSTGDGRTNSTTLASMGELGQRIDAARLGLGKSIVNALAVAALREDERIAAHRQQESADRLQDRASAAEAKAADRKQPILRRRMGSEGE